MKREGFLYPKVYDFANLYQAYLDSRKGKRNKKEVIIFEMNLGRNLIELKKELLEKTYRPSEYNIFSIKEPKERIIMAPSFKDRILHHSLCDNVLLPLFERHYIKFNFANRHGKGTHAALNELSKQMQKLYFSSKRDIEKGYVLKCDISKFFYSINHKVLKQKLERIIKDPDLLWLLHLIIDSTNGEVGIPIGNLTSQHFANFFLSDMDHVIKEKLKIKHYIRYMDDFTLIHEDKRHLVYCKDFLGEYLTKIGLRLNSKTQIFPIKNGVDFLGFHTYITDSGKIVRKLRRSSKKKMKRKLKYFQREYKLGRIELKKIHASIASWLGHAKHGNTYNLRKRILNKFIFTKELNGNCGL